MTFLRASGLVLMGVAVALVMGCGGSDDRTLFHSVSERASWGTGDLIAFTAFGANGQKYIYRCGPQGGNQTLLTRSTATTDPVNEGGWHPAYSPDGARVAFAARRAGGSVSIFTMDGREGDRLAVTRVTDASAVGQDGQPNWRPDGSQIVFTTSKVIGGAGTGGLDIAVVNLDGTGLEYLVATAALEQWPAFSPDASRIAFQRGPLTGPTDIIVRDLATGVEANITEGLRPGPADMTRYEAPAWGLIGEDEWIYLHSNRQGVFDLWRIRPDGTDLQHLTSDTRSDGFPDISPTGDRMIFVRDREVWSREPGPGAGDERRITRRY